MLLEGLYTVENFLHQEHEITATIMLNEAHEIFKGHFPGNPVMPGVCMLQIIKELTERAISKKLFLSVSSNIKFMAIINPEKTPKLLLKISLQEADDIIKLKNTSYFGDTVALKLNATFKILA